MAQEFPCKEPNCPEKVRYEREIIPGFYWRRKPMGVAPHKTKTVYLTCPKGHTHSYEVKVEEEKL